MAKFDCFCICVYIQCTALHHFVLMVYCTRDSALMCWLFSMVFLVIVCWWNVYSVYLGACVFMHRVVIASSWPAVLVAHLESFVVSGCNNLEELNKRRRVMMSSDGGDCILHVSCVVSLDNWSRPDSTRAMGFQALLTPCYHGMGP